MLRSLALSRGKRRPNYGLAEQLIERFWFKSLKTLALPRGIYAFI
jgi:hypothetical protein